MTDFGGEELNSLVLEAIDNIKRSLLQAPPINSAEFGQNFSLVDGRVCVRLERLGLLVNWADRYKPSLGKVKEFLTSNPCCVREFLVSQHPTNYLMHYLSLRRHEVVEVQEPQGLQRYVSTDELSVASPREEDEREGEENALDEEAIEAALQSALGEVRDALRSTGPAQRMSLTLLNSRTRWSQTHGRLFGSLKHWLRALHHLDEARDVQVDDSRGVGNDLVMLRADVAPSTAMLQDPTPPPQQQTQPLPQVPRGLPPRPRGAAPPALLQDTLAGVRVTDFYDLPLPSDAVEVSFRGAMARTTALLRRWTEEGLLHDCWHHDHDDFKKAEWFGDSVLAMEMSKMLVHNYSNLLDTAGLDARRQNAEQRLTLSLLFDELKLAQFMQRCPSSWVANNWKAKGDVLEAVMGEVALRLGDASDRGVPEGHAHRAEMTRFLRMVCEAALDRGAKLKSDEERRRIERDALRAGGGGFLMEPLDRQALNRCAR